MGVHEQVVVCKGLFSSQSEVNNMEERLMGHGESVGYLDDELDFA